MGGFFKHTQIKPTLIAAPFSGEYYCFEIMRQLPAQEHYFFNLAA